MIKFFIPTPVPKPGPSQIDFFVELVSGYTAIKWHYDQHQETNYLADYLYMTITIHHETALLLVIT
jgi:hypothetical protein